MNFRTYPCHPSLSGIVKYYWSFEDDFSASKQKIFADGCTELVFHYGDLFRKYTAEGRSHLQPRGFLHGQITRFIQLESTGSSGIFSIRFHPHGLRFVQPYPVSEMTDVMATPEELWDKSGRLFEDNLLNAENNTARAAIADEFLCNRLSNTRISDHLAGQGVAQILFSAGNIRISKLSETLGVSKRYLEKKFLETVGLTPKHFSRITRFQHTLRLLENGQEEKLTALALEGGFFDQPHFIRDFREFTGASPGHYFADSLRMSREIIS